ncbi:MAG: hypothetical protein RBR53_11935, partial [Desulforegulaceae bacterium]|nr:hypothetical protein [Desulforegulaceae bacterium]
EGDEAMRILLKENPEINKAHDKYVAFTRDEELLDAYEAHMKWQRDYNSGIESARREGEKKGIRIGVERGRQEGMRVGEERGRQEGLEKGQYLAQLAMAEKMLKKGYDIETVSEFTQIPVSDLKKI